MHAAATVKPSSGTPTGLHAAHRLMGMQPNILYCGETVLNSTQQQLQTQVLNTSKSASIYHL